MARARTKAHQVGYRGAVCSSLSVVQVRVALDGEVHIDGLGIGEFLAQLDCAIDNHRENTIVEFEYFPYQ